jgi:hypothetical protein
MSRPLRAVFVGLAFFSIKGEPDSAVPLSLHADRKGFVGSGRPTHTHLIPSRWVDASASKRVPFPLQKHRLLMPTTTTAPNTQDYKVADISLAEWGRKEIVIAEKEMPA